ncbi:hypothetical protein [Emticicia sp. C21]|uniref:hypothetical protein n=1 Tax=Emticicia sp. C21 TaxID=2302915 RepID=UPI000E94B401|nr:hypothetical protein [Emticicia sp. C21]RFS13329.1 hypothetical protein D0T08_27195 [Emticicia sp. C21]
MATLKDFKRSGRKLVALATTAFATLNFSCSKDDPINPGGGQTTRVNETKVEHVYDVGINIKVSDASSNFFTPVSIRKIDGTVANGMDASVTGQDASRVATGASTADMIKFKMSYDTTNIAYNANALVPKDKNKRVIAYRAADDRELKEFVVYKTAAKPDGGTLTTETHYHPKEASILAPEKGVRFLGKTFTTPAIYNNFLKNSVENTDFFASFSFMSLEKPATVSANSFYKLENK